jgi:hypothetical protein
MSEGIESKIPSACFDSDSCSDEAMTLRSLRTARLAFEDPEDTILTSPWAGIIFPCDVFRASCFFLVGPSWVGAFAGHLRCTFQTLPSTVGAGTDATRVSSYNPYLSLYWLITGKTISGLGLYPEENRLDQAEALKLYTMGSSWFSTEDLRQASDAARSFDPMSKEQVATLLAKTSKAAKSGEYESERSNDMPIWDTCCNQIVHVVAPIIRAWWTPAKAGVIDEFHTASGTNWVFAPSLKMT